VRLRRQYIGPQRSTPSSRRWSYIALGGVVLLGVVLAIMLPNAQPQELRLRISCLSGARIVGVWVEAERGGSGWAEPIGTSRGDQSSYRYRLDFGGPFQVNIGCGGNSGDWKIGAQSSSTTETQRTLECDDLAPGPTWWCRDVAP
jgi:hypothetical protein